MSRNALCRPSTVDVCVSLSLTALSKASRWPLSWSSSSATRSPKFSRSDLSSMARTSQSCMACFAVSNSSLAYASRCINSSLSLTQFCCDNVARLRKLEISEACSSVCLRSCSLSSRSRRFWSSRSSPSPPVALISDFFLGWTHQLARHLRLPRLVFSPSGAFALSVSFSLWRDLPENPEPDNANSLISFPNIPNSPVYPWWQISSHYRENKRGDPEWEFHRENTLDNIASYGVVFNTFTELERVYLHHIKRHLGHDRVWAVGPVLPPKDDDSVGSADRGGPSSVPCHEVLTWLDTRSDYSVVYVCFGSRTVLTSRQMEVLTNALEVSGVHFILSVRGPDERHVGEDIGVIPEEFEDRVRGRGFVIKGWAPQLAILGHRAVGSFLTHCGWNSVLEGLAAGVVMATWPMGADQYTNAKLMVDELGAGVRAAEGTENVPDAKELGGIIKRSLQENSRQRIRAKQLKEAALDAIKPEGSSQKQLDALRKHFCELHDLKPTS